MNTNSGSVFSRMIARASHHKVLVGAAATALGAAVIFSVGMVGASGAAVPDAIVSNVAPVASSTIEPLLALDRATEAAAARVTPAVVNINVVGHSGNAQSGPGGQMQQQMSPQQIPEPFRQFFGQGSPFQFRQYGQPQQREFSALGTGLIISPNGYIVTNNHVVAGATHVEVTMHNKRQYTATVVGTDKPTDLAVIKIDATGLPSAAWGDSSKLVPGQTVLAIGDPLGMDFSVTRGIVSAVDRSRSLADGPDARGVFIQTDAPINHGNSGGPLVNARGEVVGINAEMLTTSGASAGIGFSIPSNLVKRTAEQLIEHGKVVRGYLGIDVTPLTPSVADSLNESGTEGALVNQVSPGSPAAQAGLKPYDVITGFNNEKVTSGSDLQMDAGAAAPGSKATLHVMRDGKAITVPVTMGDLSKANSGSAGVVSGSGNNSKTPKLGVEVEPVTPQLRSRYRLPDTVSGLLVQAVTPGSPAMIAGINPGDVIEQINRKPVSTVNGLRTQLQQTAPGKSVLLMVHNANGDFILPVTPQE